MGMPKVWWDLMMFSLNSDLTSGNYSLLYKQQLSTGGVGLAPIGRFYLNQTDSLRGLPFLRLDGNITWPTGSVPLDQPVCGFQGELCPSDDYCDIAIGVVGGLIGVLLVVGGVAYRNWRYEQGFCYQLTGFLDLQSETLTATMGNFIENVGFNQWETFVISGFSRRKKKQRTCLNNRKI